jgi:H+-transporting ATPase
MTSLGWGYAVLVWGYALAWFLVTDRVKLLAYRILDPVSAVAAVPNSAPRVAPDLSNQNGSTSKVAPLHTDTDPEEPVYHDNRDCPYG